MKFQFIYFFLFCFFLQGFSQDKNSKKADKLFYKNQFFEATKAYEKLEHTQHVLTRLGDCYLYENKINQSIEVYEKLFETYQETLVPQNYFNYAQALMKSDNYTKSDPIMSQYLKYSIITPNFLYNLKSVIPYSYTIQMMAKSNENGDFGMVSFDGKVIYSSAKNTGISSYAGNIASNYDLTVADINRIGLIIDSKPFSKEINSKLHESSPTFSGDGKTMYFCRTNDKKAKTEDIHFAYKSIFKSQLVNGVWTSGKKLPFCNSKYSYESPVLSPDAKKLYFSSNGDGSIGGFDIFYVNIDEKGNYSDPINVGNGVNTIQNEMYPFISDTNSVLYFSSNGHQGMGGMDIFSCDVFRDEYQNVLNLGSSINSNYDDFSFNINDVTNKGFMTSNRENGFTNLYSFERLKNEMNFFVQGNVVDKNTKKPLANTTVSLFDLKGEKVAEMVPSNKTEFILKAKPNTKYVLKASNKECYDFEETIITTTDGKARYFIELFKKIN